MGMVPLTLEMFYLAKFIHAIVLKKGLLMSYGKTLELGFLGLRGKQQDRFYLKDRMITTYMGQKY
jgi:hypothetical protein